MGSITEFSIDGYSLLQTKSYADNEVLAIFRESDKCVVDRSVSPEDDELYTVILYQCTAWKIAQRLDIMGFTLVRAKQDFEQFLREAIKEIPSAEEDKDELYTARREQLGKMTFEQYAKNLRSVMSRRLRPEMFGRSKRTDVTDMERYILDDHYEERLLLGYFCSDLRFLIRLSCSLVSPDAIVEQDLTDVVNAGYYQMEEPISSNALKALTSDYPINAKIIVLTEGSSDATILQETLSILYPHLTEFYSFFDFGASRAAGESCAACECSQGVHCCRDFE